MKDYMVYKSYVGSVRFSAEDEVFYGRLEGLKDLVSYEGQSVEELKRAFHEAVEDYLAFCKKKGKAPEQPFKGSFNVRLTPALHRKAATKAAMEGISLNQLIQKAVEEKVQT
jgi:predicted HicB family RNase H-like nuclease